MDNRTRTPEVKKVRQSALLRVLWMLVLSAMAMPSLGRAVQRWERYIYGDTDMPIAEGYGVRQTPDGGYIVAGRFAGDAYWSPLLLRLDSLGDTLWRRCYLPPDEWGAGFRSVLSTPDGGCIAVGCCQFDTSSFPSALYVLRADSMGNTVWSRGFFWDQAPQGLDIARARDGGYIVLAAGAVHDSAFIILVRIDSLGDVLWKELYADSNYPVNGSVVQTRDGGFISATNSSYPWGRLIRVDSLGHMIWSRLYRYSNSAGQGSELVSIDTTPDGGFIAAGAAMDTTTGRVGAWLVRTDSVGETTWTRWYGSQHSAVQIERLCSNGRGGFTGAGVVYLSTNLGHFWMLSFSADGDSEWSRTFGQRSEIGEGIDRTSDGGFIMVGVASPTVIYLVKTDANGALGVQPEPDAGPRQASEVQLAAATWAGPDRRLRYYIPRTSKVTLRVYDEIGRKQTSINAGTQDPGWHEFSFPGGLPAGVLFIRLDACGQRAFAKVVGLISRE